MSLSFHHYHPTPLESAIEKFYHKKNIYSPADLDPEIFAEDANIKIYFRPLSSVSFQFRAFQSIIIDSRLPIRQQKVELAHELGHVLLHVGRQDFMNDDFRAMQEWQADRFAMYSLAPTSMIKDNLISTNSRSLLIAHLSDIFDVPDTFIEARLHLLEERLRALSSAAQLNERIMENRATYDYSYRHPTNPQIEYLVKDGSVVGRRRRAGL